jgi:hypothetical protein
MAATVSVKTGKITVITPFLVSPPLKLCIFMETCLLDIQSGIKKGKIKYYTATAGVQHEFIIY